MVHLAQIVAGAGMLGRKERDQLELFISGSLRQLIPDEHILVRVDAVLDLAWLRDDIADLYCGENGRPGIDPEVAVRLMLAGFLLGIVHDRRLMREAAVNIAIRWFVGYGLHEALPDHSSLTRIRAGLLLRRLRQPTVWISPLLRHLFQVLRRRHYLSTSDKPMRKTRLLKFDDVHQYFNTTCF